MDLTVLSVLVLGHDRRAALPAEAGGRASAATCPACHVQMVYLADVPVVSSRMGRQRALAAMLFGDEEAALYRCPRCGHREQIDY